MRCRKVFYPFEIEKLKKQTCLQKSKTQFDNTARALDFIKGSLCVLHLK